MKNPFKDRDLHTQLLFPALSWSSFNAFVSYNKDKWYEQYVLGIRGGSNPAMEAGREIGERLLDPTYLPQVPRPEIYEQQLKAKIYDITLIGHLDGWSPGIPELLEYKTTTNINRWNEEEVRFHGQIDMYALLLWENFKVYPQDLKIRLVSILLKENGQFKLEPTGEIKVIPTTRSMKDLLVFGARLKATHSEMLAFVAAKEDLRYNESIIKLEDKIA